MSDIQRHPLTELVPDYVLGLLTGDELREFETAFGSSEALRKEVADYRELHAYLAGRETVNPPNDLKDRLMARVAADKTVPLPVRRARTPIWWTVAVAALAVLSVGLGLRVRDLDVAVKARDSLVAETARQLTDRQATLDALLDPGVKLTTMVAPGQAPPVVQIFHNRARGTVLLHANQLPPAPSGRVYQLWLMPIKGNPIPSITFNTDAAGRQVVSGIPVTAGTSVAGFALSVEPAGGSAQPTTTPILVGME